MAQGVAHGFGGDLQEVGALAEGQLRGERRIDLATAFGRAQLLHLAEQGFHGLGKRLLAQGLGLKAHDEIAHVVDRGVERGAALIEARRGFQLIGLQQGADTGETHAGGVERLDDAVMQVAAQPDAFIEGTPQLVFTGQQGALGLPPPFHLLPQLVPLGVCFLQQPGHAAEFSLVLAQSQNGAGIVAGQTCINLPERAKHPDAQAQAQGRDQQQAKGEKKRQVG